MLISDWSSDVCSSDLSTDPRCDLPSGSSHPACARFPVRFPQGCACPVQPLVAPVSVRLPVAAAGVRSIVRIERSGFRLAAAIFLRSEEHTSELQSLMRISYAVFCLQKKTNKTTSSTVNLSINIQ